MADEMPIIPKVGEISIHTGNIVNWNRLKKKLTQLPNEELAECISSTIDNWLTHADKTQLQYETKLQCINTKFMETLPASEREGLKVTVKIFLNDLTPAAVEEAVEKVLDDLGVSNIETVLLSVPEKQRSLAMLQPLWETLEGLTRKGKIYTLGLVDLNREQLQALHDWAQVKPSIDQVNLASCCVMPQELTEYAKQHDIQLLTHNDPTDILPTKELQQVLTTSLTARDAESWSPSWVVRYSVLIKCRGIIKTKGYICKAARDIRNCRN